MKCLLHCRSHPCSSATFRHFLLQTSKENKSIKSILPFSPCPSFSLSLFWRIKSRAQSSTTSSRTNAHACIITMVNWYSRYFLLTSPRLLSAICVCVRDGSLHMIHNPASSRFLLLGTKLTPKLESWLAFYVINICFFWSGNEGRERDVCWLIFYLLHPGRMRYLLVVHARIKYMKAEGDDGGVIKVKRVGVSRKSISSLSRQRLNRLYFKSRGH
jgi:hypothetical protein